MTGDLSAVWTSRLAGVWVFGAGCIQQECRWWCLFNPGNIPNKLVIIIHTTARRNVTCFTLQIAMQLNGFDTHMGN